MVLGDSFILFGENLYNLTYTIDYFNFFESRQELKSSFTKMKDLKATGLLGKRLFPNSPMTNDKNEYFQ